MKGKIHPIGASRHLLKESYKAEAPSGSVNVLQITKADIPYSKRDVFRYNKFTNKFRCLKPTKSITNCTYLLKVG
jgi:hypothetical protein